MYFFTKICIAVCLSLFFISCTSTPASKRAFSQCLYQLNQQSMQMQQQQQQQREMLYQRQMMQQQQQMLTQPIITPHKFYNGTIYTPEGKTYRYQGTEW